MNTIIAILLFLALISLVLSAVAAKDKMHGAAVFNFGAFVFVLVCILIQFIKKAATS